MNSDLKKLLRFTSLQSSALMIVIFSFSMCVCAFLIYCAGAQINARLSLAEKELTERVLKIDERVQSLTLNIIHNRNLAELHLRETPIGPFHSDRGISGRLKKKKGTVTDQGFIYRKIDKGPDVVLNEKSDPLFHKEIDLAASLCPAQFAMMKSSESIYRTYYYSHTFRFFTAYSNHGYTGVIDNESGKINDVILKIFNEVIRHKPFKDAETPFWAGPFHDPVENRFFLINAARLYSNNTLKGYFINDISHDVFSTFTHTMFDEYGHTILASRTGTILSSSLPELQGHFRNPQTSLKSLLPDRLKYLSDDLLFARDSGFSWKHGYLIITADLDKAPWSLIYVIHIKDFMRFMLPRMKVYIFIITATVIMLLTGTVLFSKRFIKPVRLAESAIQNAYDELETLVSARTSELVRMNAELGESREKYKQLFINAPAGIYEIDFVNGRFVSFNDLLCEYTGYSREELLNIDPNELLSQRGREILKERLTKMLNGEKISRNVELDIVTKYGFTFTAELNNSFIFRDGKLTGSRVVIHDVTKRKAAHIALEKSEERFRNLVESTSDWIWELDRKGCFLYSSPGAETVLGHAVQDLTGKNFTTFVPPGDIDRFSTILNEKKGKDQSPCSTEFRVIHRNGEFKDIESRSVHFYNEHGKHMGVRGISRDVTERKKQAAEKAELQKNLHRAKKMEALGLLAGGVAHDLNNILSGIINYPELILLDMDNKNPARKHVEAIYTSGRKAAEIVDDLLTMARGAARNKEHVRINSIVSDYLASAEYDALIARHPSVRVNASMTENLHFAMISPVQLKKTILNLVTNAVESLHTNGHVFISTRNITLSEPIRGYDDIPAGEYVVLSVADTGSGISNDELDRIFEPFYSKKIMGRSGTGLGLAIVWNTVLDSEGHINVVSGRNGTVFDLYFPAVHLPDSALSKHEHGTTIMGKGEKILVVDDESLQREIASQILSILQYSAVAMESGEKAIEYMKHEKVDLVLLDMVMGTGMNGRETFERIIENHPDQKVVIATGYVDSSEVAKVREKGADELLKKPYTMEELGKAISRKLNGYYS